MEGTDTGKFTLMYSGNDSNTFGTSLLINKKYKKAIMYFEVVDESLCSLRTRRAFNNFTIISVHRLTKEKDGLINDSLHKKLNQIYKRIPTFDLKLKWVILMPKYQNRKTRSLHTNYRQVIGLQQMILTNNNKTIQKKNTFFPHKNTYK